MLYRRAPLDQRQIPARVFENHRFVDHRQLQVRRGVVHRHARRLGEQDEEQADADHHQRRGGGRPGGRQWTAEHPGQGEAPGGEGQPCEAQEQRRFGKRGERHFATGAHPLEARAGVEPPQHQHEASQRQQVGERDEIAREAHQRATPIERHDRRCEQRRRHDDDRGQAEHPRGRRAVDGPLSKQLAQVPIELEHGRATPAGEQRSRLGGDARQQRGHDEERREGHERRPRHGEVVPPDVARYKSSKSSAAIR